MVTALPRQRWAILALLFATRASLGFNFQTAGSVADSLVGELGLNFTEVGTLIGLFNVPGLVLSIPSGLAGRYASDRALVAIGLGALALGGAVAFFAHGFGLLALARLLSGAGFVLSTLYFTKMVADWFANRELATAMAVLVMSWPFGIAMGQVGHGWLAVHLGWRTPFLAAALYCGVAAIGLLVCYRAPAAAATDVRATSIGLTRREWILTLIASLVWAAFNAAYIVYLSFAPRLLMAGGVGPLEAASIISLASWVMIFSGAVCGQLADRLGRSDLILSICLCSAMAALLLLSHVGWSVPLSLTFGLIGMAPAGIIMALTGSSMAPEKRAFGMGLFLSAYFVLTAPAPGIAGWLYDRSHDAYLPVVFAVCLFALALGANFAFRLAQRVLA